MTISHLGSALAHFLKTVSNVLSNSASQSHASLDTIKDQLDASLKWVATEPYNEVLYARVLSVIDDELMVFWRMGKLKGADPEQAFFTRCDETTMTPADIAAHRVVCLIGVATVTPGEFILFDIVHTAI